MQWTVLCAPRISCWIPKPQCDGIWRWGLWEISRFRWGHEGWDSHDGISALRRGGRGTRTFSAMSGPSEKAVVCKSGWESPPETNPAGLWSWTSSLQNCEKINFCCLSLPACGILLWQPNQTNTIASVCLRAGTEWNYFVAYSCKKNDAVPYYFTRNEIVAALFPLTAETH